MTLEYGDEIVAKMSVYGSKVTLDSVRKVSYPEVRNGKFKVTENMVNAALEEAVIFADHYSSGYGSEEESKLAFIKAVIQAAADQWLEDNT